MILKIIIKIFNFYLIIIIDLKILLLFLKFINIIFIKYIYNN